MRFVFETLHVSHKTKTKIETIMMKVGNTQFSYKFQINYIGRLRLMRHWQSREEHIWDDNF